MLLAASDAADVDGDALSFRIESIGAGAALGEFSLDGQAIVLGTTLIAPAGQPLIWTPTQAGTLVAFAVVAFDGALGSSTPVSVEIRLMPNSLL